MLIQAASFTNTASLLCPSDQRTGISIDLLALRIPSVPHVTFEVSVRCLGQGRGAFPLLSSCRVFRAALLLFMFLYAIIGFYILSSLSSTCYSWYPILHVFLAFMFVHLYALRLDARGLSCAFASFRASNSVVPRYVHSIFIFICCCGIQRCS